MKIISCIKNLVFNSHLYALHNLFLFLLSLNSHDYLPIQIVPVIVSFNDEGQIKPLFNIVKASQTDFTLSNEASTKTYLSIISIISTGVTIKSLIG